MTNSDRHFGRIQTHRRRHSCGRGETTATEQNLSGQKPAFRAGSLAGSMNGRANYQPSQGNMQDRRFDSLPEPGEYVLAQCDSFRCLAFVDSDGQWKDFFHETVLPGVRSWIRFE